MVNIKSWLRIFFPKKYQVEVVYEEINWNMFESNIGYSIKNKELFRTSLRHRSHPSCSAPLFYDSNERYEFLGDSIVNLCIAEFLYNNFPDAPEGDLTKMRAIFASREYLARIGRNLKLGQFLALGEGEEKSGGRKKDSIISNTVESVVCAIYLDGGMSKANEFVENIVLYNYKTILKSEGVNHKGELLEFLQKQKMPMPKFVVQKASGPDHQKIYSVCVVIGDKPYGEGKGKTKKIAEQEASKITMKKIKSVKRNRNGRNYKQTKS